MKGIKKVIAFVALTGLLAGCSGGSGAASEESKEKEAPKEITVYFTRHGKTMLNTMERAQGWSDAPLTPAGIEVAEAVGKGIGDSIKFDKVYSSDSGRAIETAEVILENAGQNVPVEKDKRLKEFNFGSYEGLPSEEMIVAIAKEKNADPENYFKGIAQNGFIQLNQQLSNDLAAVDEKNVKEGENWPAEDYDTVVKRGTEAVEDIVAKAEKEGDEDILIVSHGMTLAAILNELDDRVAEEIPVSGLENASISKAVYKNGKWTVESINDLSYVEK
ncbi:MAG: histidine phosphatase family protein [Enterococcus gilvus]